MCLSVAVHRPADVLAYGIHAGHEFVVVHNGMGYRCGYVKVEPGHPWHGKDYNDIDCNVHGGLTFAAADVPCDQGGPDNGWWLGVDACHAGDAKDPSLPSDRPSFDLGLPDDTIHRRDVVRTQEYMEAECRRLCEQARDASLMTIGRPETSA